MESLAVLQYDSSMPLAGLSYVGDLHWVQRKLLPWKRTDSRYNVSIIEDGQYELAQVLRSYNSRDCIPTFHKHKKKRSFLTVFKLFL